MLRKLEKVLFDQYADLAYSLALDTRKSGYPIYTDGIKTKEDFIKRARKALERDNEEILLYERSGEVLGWIHYYYLADDRYLDTCSFCIREGMGDAVAEFTAFARERFPGSELYLGFPKENTEAVAALEALGFERIEESYNNAADLEQYRLAPERAETQLITRESYPLFAEIHRQHDGETYWNTERILADLDGWRIFVSMQGETVTGAIYTFTFADKHVEEIFGVDFPDGVYDGEAYRALVTAAMNDEKRRGVRHLVLLADEETQADTLRCGFRCVGEYVCYLLRL